MSEIAVDPGEPVSGAAGQQPEPDPTDAEVAAFLNDLRDLRARNGAPSYATLARRTGLPRSTVYDGLRRDRLPTLDLTVALVRALGADETRWRERWSLLRCRLDRPVSGPADTARTIPNAPGAVSGAVSGGPTVVAEPSSLAAPADQSRPPTGNRRGPLVRFWRGRRHRLLALLAVLVLVVGVAGYLAIRSSSGHCQAGELYAVTSDGDLLDTSRAVIATVSKGEQVLVRSHNHDVYLHRLLGTVQGSGKAGSGKMGYVDEARLDPIRAVCTH
ncbi:MAG: hypothetical protein ACR2N4_10220 [Jatrophihabitans sp.]